MACARQVKRSEALEKPWFFGDFLKCKQQAMKPAIDTVFIKELGFQSLSAMSPSQT
jgi:hypothetical protein